MTPKFYTPLTKLALLTALTYTALAHADSWIATADNCKAYNPFPQPNETIVWTGDCKDGYVHGFGNFYWYKDDKLNEVYQGTYHKGRMHGTGLYRWNDGSMYEGGFNTDMLHGFGKFTFPKDSMQIMSWESDGIGFWQGNHYIVQGIFIDDVLEYDCNNKKDCDIMLSNGMDKVGGGKK